LFLRDKKKLSEKLSGGCSVIQGDAMNYNDVMKAVTDQDIVYINLAGNL
jgi:hypothetical protein